MCKSLSFKNGVMVPENTGRKLYKECHLKMMFPSWKKPRKQNGVFVSVFQYYSDKHHTYQHI